MYCVYILKSKNCNRYYIGSAHDIDKRVKYHNSGKVISTKAYRPWELIRHEVFENKTAARKRELQIKSYKSGEAFKKLIDGEM